MQLKYIWEFTLSYIRLKDYQVVSDLKRWSLLLHAGPIESTSRLECMGPLIIEQEAQAGYGDKKVAH